MFQNDKLLAWLLQEKLDANELVTMIIELFRLDIVKSPMKTQKTCNLVSSKGEKFLKNV